MGLLFGIVFVWSVVYETLLPLLRAGDVAGLVAHLLGVPIIVAGTIGFAYGGFRALHGVSTLLQDSTFQEHALTIKKQPSSEGVHEARRVHLRMWMAALKRGVLWMALGFTAIAVGGWIINL